MVSEYNCSYTTHRNVLALNNYFQLTFPWKLANEMDSESNALTNLIVHTEHLCRLLLHCLGREPIGRDVSIHQKWNLDDRNFIHGWTNCSNELLLSTLIRSPLHARYLLLHPKSSLKAPSTCRPCEHCGVSDCADEDSNLWMPITGWKILKSLICQMMERAVAF